VTSPPTTSFALEPVPLNRSVCHWYTSVAASPSWGGISGEPYCANLVWTDLATSRLLYYVIYTLAADSLARAPPPGHYKGPCKKHVHVYTRHTSKHDYPGSPGWPVCTTLSLLGEIVNMGLPGRDQPWAIPSNHLRY
jgi:hypothetical protein